MMLSGDGRDAWYRYLRHMPRHRRFLHTHPLLQVHVQTLQFENPLLEQTKIRVETATLFYKYMYVAEYADGVHCYLHHNPKVVVAPCHICQSVTLSYSYCSTL